MATKHQEEQDAEGQKKGRQQLQAIIGDKVIDGLGQPNNLHLVQVRKLWDDRYRVNVFTGADAATAVVAHSSFLVTDDAGNIIAANPKITRVY